jgi:hypothetical protein
VFFSHHVELGSGGSQLLHQRVAEAVSPGLKLPERESDHSLSYSVEDNNLTVRQRVVVLTRSGYFICVFLHRRSMEQNINQVECLSFAQN